MNWVGIALALVVAGITIFVGAEVVKSLQCFEDACELAGGNLSTTECPPSFDWHMGQRICCVNTTKDVEVIWRKVC